MLPFLLPWTHESRINAQKRHGDQYLTLDDVTYDVGSIAHLPVIKWSWPICKLSTRQARDWSYFIFEIYESIFQSNLLDTYIIKKRDHIRDKM